MEKGTDDDELMDVRISKDKPESEYWLQSMCGSNIEEKHVLRRPDTVYLWRENVARTRY